MWVLILEPDPHIVLQHLMSRKNRLCSRIELASSLVPVLGFASSSFQFSSLSVKQCQRHTTSSHFILLSTSSKPFPSISYVHIFQVFCRLLRLQTSSFKLLQVFQKILGFQVKKSLKSLVFDTRKFLECKGLLSKSVKVSGKHKIWALVFWL